MLEEVYQRTCRAVIYLSLGSLTACSDGILSPQLDHGTAVTAAKRSPSPVASPTYWCDLYTLDALGSVHHRKIELKFSKSAVHNKDYRREYRYDGFSGAQMSHTGKCVIPATDKAIRDVDRLFHLSGRPERPADDVVTTMSCPPGNEVRCFELGEVTTVACQGGGTYPDCNDLPEEYEQCDWWNPCGGDTGGGTGTPLPGGGSPPPTPCWDCEIDKDAPCRTGDPVIDSPEVYGIFNNLWSQSNYGRDIPQDQRSEHGAWIILENGRYSARPMNAISSPCGLDEVEPKPVNAVSMIHTHPWHLGEVMTSCDYQVPYLPTASDEDARALADLGFGYGFIMDADGISRIYPNRGGYSDSRKNRCSY